jgi:hypothetical protein
MRAVAQGRGLERAVVAHLVDGEVAVGLRTVREQEGCRFEDGQVAQIDVGMNAGGVEDERAGRPTCW